MRPNHSMTCGRPGPPSPTVARRSAHEGADPLDGRGADPRHTVEGVRVGEPTGPLALLHDANGLIGLARRGVALTIVVTNNDGGSIFSFLPQAAVVDAGVFETLYGTPHGVSFASLAAAHGIGHVEVGNVASLAAAVASARDGGVRIVEARFDRGSNPSLHEDLNAAVVAAVESALAG